MDSGLQIHFHGIRVHFTFGFFAVWAFLMLQSEAAYAAMAGCILHEAGHIAAMRLLGLKINSLTFSGSGIAMRTEFPLSLSGLGRELAVLSAGCMINLILYIMLSLAQMKTAAMTNLALMLFNLLPVSYLDGGRIMTALLRCVTDADISAVMRITDTVIGIAAAVFFFCHGSVSFTLPLTLGLIIIEGLLCEKNCR